MTEQARDAPQGEFLLFDGRVHTYEAVDRRINNVVRGLIDVGVRQGARVGVLMETRPSALVAIAALSRLGAVAVLMPPDADLADGGPARRRSPRSSTDPSNLEAARELLGMRVLVLGGGEARDLHLARRRRRHRHGEDRPGRRRAARLVPAQPGTGPGPGVHRVQHGRRRTGRHARSPTTGGRCRRSAPRRRPTSSRNDTVYCLTPLHHQSGLLVSLGGAVVGGTRIALSRGLRPDRFVQEIRQYGVTVVSYTWAMLRDVIDDPAVRRCTATIRCGCSSAPACRPGCGSASSRCSRPRTSSSSSPPPTGRPCWPTSSGAKIGSKGRPLPGGGESSSAAYDAERRPDPRGRPRLRAAAPRPTRSACCSPIRAGRSIRRRRSSAACSPRPTPGCRPSTCSAATRTATTGWSTTAAAVIRTARGPGVRRDGQRRGRTAGRGRHGGDLRACEAGGQTLAVTALALRPGGSVPSADLSEALADLPVGVAARHRARGAATWRSARPTGRWLGPLRAAGHPEAVA